MMIWSFLTVWRFLTLRKQLLPLYKKCIAFSELNNFLFILLFTMYCVLITLIYVASICILCRGWKKMSLRMYSSEMKTNSCIKLFSVVGFCHNRVILKLWSNKVKNIDTKHLLFSFCFLFVVFFAKLVQRFFRGNSWFAFDVKQILKIITEIVFRFQQNFA